MRYRNWKESASQVLRQPDRTYRRMLMVHIGIVLGASLGVNLLLELIGLLGGSGSMEKQAAIETAQTILPMVITIAQLYWVAGLQQAAMERLIDHPVGFVDLTAGFGRWKPITTSTIFIGLQYFGRAFIATFLAELILGLTPYAKILEDAAMQMVENPELDLFAVLGERSMEVLGVYMGLILVITVALVLPLYYRYRMVNYILLQQPEVGGMQAMFFSKVMTFGHRMELFKLDLSFWWYYLINALASAAVVGDLVLIACGVRLPLPALAVQWIFMLLSAILQFAAFMWGRPKMELAFAQAYRDLSVPREMPGGDVVDAEPNF